MKLVRRSATGALAALAITMAGPALGASAAGYHFQTLSSVAGGKVQACRVLTPTSKPYLIKMRVDARQASGKVSGVGSATHNGTRVGKAWNSGWIRRGHLSTVGTVSVPRGSAYALDAGIGAGQMGNGGSVNPVKIHSC